MKKLLFFFSLLLVASVLNGQSKVAEKISEFEQNGRSFIEYSLFNKDNTQGDYQKYLKTAPDVTLLTIDEVQLQKIANEGPELISLTIPYKDEEIEVLLYNKNILMDSFRLVNQDGEELSYSPGQYYRGIIKGNEESLVGISFFEEDVMGVISAKNYGNINLGKTTDGKHLVTFSDNQFMGKLDLSCGADEIPYNEKVYEGPGFDPAAATKTGEDKCVGMHFETSHNVYINFSYTPSLVFEWFSGLFNNLSLMYENEGIEMGMTYLLIWETADPYIVGEDSLDYLYNFADFSGEVHGDLAHLVNIPASTSWAFVDVLCSEWKYGFSGIWEEYDDFPTYSWAVNALTHEIGHNFGSSHTHACVWNGDETAIDGCGPLMGYDDGCDGPLPDEGTIMSYCHLVEDIGVNLALGFGPQPGDLIRDRYFNAPCLGSDCSYLSVVDLTADAEGGISVFPNPTSGILNVISHDKKILNYRLTDTGGKIIRKERAEVKETRINVSALPSGVYILNLDMGDREISKKVIKK